MFNSIRGIVSGKGSDSIYLFSGDIEWEISMPLNDMESLAMNKECRIFTWMYHREDQMRIYGFINERRRSAFLEMIKVEGVGPKGAIKIMGGIDQDDFEDALNKSDLARLEMVPGLGKKTAQKMLLALKGKLVSSQEFALPVTPYSEIVDALAAMGYDRRTAAEALAKAEATVDAAIPEAEREKILFKEAIVYLSGV